MMLSDKPKSVREWVKLRESIGHPTFSLGELNAAMPRYGRDVLNTELCRLAAAGIIIPIYRGFYVTVPIRYLRTGIVPPTFYIDSLAAYMERPYYMSLLSAAMIHGAAHQKSQVEFVTTVPPRMSLSVTKNPHLRWVYRPSINSQFILTRNGEGGVIRYSSAEYTALDLVQYAHHCGGLGEVATVLAELVETMEPSKISSELLAEFKGVTVQRLGYILDEVLKSHEIANALYTAFKGSGGRLLPVRLNPASDCMAESVDARWKVAVNCELEVDEI